MTYWSVIDLETTGFGKTDRVVEIGVVVLDPASGEIVDEFDTLINPGRDIGATAIHGVSASMVEAAPTFEEVAGSLARVIEGNVLVAHNLPFDSRFLLSEFTRAGIDLDPGVGVCTLQMSGERLEVACQRYAIDLTSHHRALADARATGELLMAIDATLRGTPAGFAASVAPGMPRTLRRESVSDGSNAPMRTHFTVRYPVDDHRKVGR